MKGNLHHIVACRKLSVSSKQRLVDAGLVVKDHEFVSIEYDLGEDQIETLSCNEDPWVFTSKHAVVALEKVIEKGLTLKTKDCFAIEPSTAELAQKASFNILGTGRNSLELGNAIISTSDSKVLKHICSLDRMDVLYKLMKQHGKELRSVELYKKKAVGIQVTKADGVLFFSPSQVRAYFLKNTLQPSSVAFCIGSTTENYIRNQGHHLCCVAKRAEEESIIDSVISYKNYE